MANLLLSSINLIISFSTPIEIKESAEKYPKNFSLLKMAEKYKKRMEEGKDTMSASMISQDTRSSVPASVPLNQSIQSQPEPVDQGDLCPTHKKKIEIICIDCKERICSNCALFGVHKPHDIRMEQDVLDEISLRSECLMEMYQLVAQSAAEKPDEAVV